MVNIDWTLLTTRPHAGKTLPEVMLDDPDYVLRGLEAGLFQGLLLLQAREICRRAARIRPCLGAPDDVAVLYSLHPFDTDEFGGYVVLRRSNRWFAEYRASSAAESPYFDLTMPRRLASKDKDGVHVVLGGVKLEYFGSVYAVVSQEEAEDFFSDPECIVE